MQRTMSRNSKFGFTAFGLGLGGIAAGVALSANDVALAVFAFVAIAGFCVYLAFSRSEWAVIQGPAADERERSINMRAMQLAYSVVVAVSVIGWLGEVRRGHAGPFTLVCAVGGFTYMGAVAVLKSRS